MREELLTGSGAQSVGSVLSVPEFSGPVNRRDPGSADQVIDV